MRFPEFLKEHGTIGFVAPSFGCATEPYYTAFAHARERFGQMGLILVVVKVKLQLVSYSILVLK